VSEYVTEAIVLDKLPAGEQDLRVVFFTPSRGKLTAHVTSGRKITSKLSPHLEPLKLSVVRFIEKVRLTAVDALTIRSLPRGNLSAVRLLAAALPDHEPDMRLWHLLITGELGAPTALKLLGFDPRFSTCTICGRGEPAHFDLHDLSYICEPCLPHSVRPSSYVSIGVSPPTR
jgi:recombinational DNA repair protein (RecF pathway)